ncbi:MAG: DUF3558 domain-containing protein [Actinomycetota bacterium]|nr:DUF3558 domain-containing protein [Actinomycetota bacterium]
MRRPLLVAAAALLVLVSGCSEQTEGTPTADGDTTPERTITTDPDAPTTESSEPSSGGEEPSPIGDLQPCELIDQAGLSSLGLTGGEEDSVGSARSCRWRHEGATLNESFTVAVELFDDEGFDDLAETTDVKEVPDVGSHKAVSFVDAAGVCGVSLRVGDTARVDNTAVGGDQQQGCQLAAQLAALVEPKLP